MIAQKIAAEFDYVCTFLQVKAANYQRLCGDNEPQIYEDGIHRLSEKADWLRYPLFN